jgi:hypothetical protein
MGVDPRGGWLADGGKVRVLEAGRADLELGQVEVLAVGLAAIFIT